MHSEVLFRALWLDFEHVMIFFIYIMVRGTWTWICRSRPRITTYGWLDGHRAASLLEQSVHRLAFLEYLYRPQPGLWGAMELTLTPNF
jgi:hypothetical protein